MMAGDSNVNEDWSALPPDRLLDRPSLLKGKVAVTESRKALAYAHQPECASYDERAHRLSAASPYRGAVPLQSITRMLVERERDREAARIRRVRREHDALRPRALDLPIDDGRIRYEFKADTMDFFIERESDRGVTYEESWCFGRSHPPQLMQRGAIGRDASQTLNQRYRVALSHAAWVPLSLLVECGRFWPRQDWESRLLRQVEAGRLYLFISHRWRSPDHPDPEGSEAALLAWQLLDHLLEAVLIAWRRGLHVPRQYSPALGQVIGLAGRELSESLIVNVLRPQLGAQDVETAAQEAAEVELALTAGPLAAAEADVGLARMQALLAHAPVLRHLAGQISLWYDYACLPQEPRSPQDQTVFDAGLGELSPIQMMGMTAVLIDRPEHYMERAWCTLEAVSANVANEDLVLLHAEPPSKRESPDDEVGHYFVLAMSDRPHVVRRAVLDTVLFGIQTPVQCFQRLRIALTQAGDLDRVFDLLRQVSATPGVHVDASSVVTGCWPLPVGADGRIVLPVRSPPLESLEDSGGQPGSLDIAGSLTLLDGTSRRVVPARVEYPVAEGMRRAQVVVIGACEGDAILIAGWLADRRSALESEVGAAVSGICWVSDDVAAVGHMACGRLEPSVLSADLWVFVGPIALIEHGQPARVLRATAAAAGVERIVVALDQPQSNLRRLAPPKASAHEAPPDRVEHDVLDLQPIDGGIFSAALGPEGPPLFLRSAPAAEPEPPTNPLEDMAPPPEQLQVLVVNAVFKGDDSLLAQLCQAYPKSIDTQFGEWMRVPEQLRDSPTHTRAYVQALMQVARQMQALGFGGPMKALLAPDDNPIIRWNDNLQMAEEAAASGERAVAVRLLRDVLEEMEGAHGSAVDNLRPKVLGKLCAYHFAEGRLDEAREAAQRALRACQEVGDEQGVSIYHQNLQLIAAAAAEGDPMVSQIARAQTLSDQGRYEVSNALLASLSLDDDSLLACKSHGLAAANHFWRGDHSAALPHAREALRIAQLIGDPDAVRVYGYNLQRIETQAAQR